MAMPSDTGSNIAKLVLILCWLIGTGALNLGLLREGTDFVATTAYIIACIGWFFVHWPVQRLRRIGRALSLVLLFFWFLNLATAAFIGGSAVYKSWFFGISSSITVLLLLYAAVWLMPNREVDPAVGRVEPPNPIAHR